MNLRRPFRSSIRVWFAISIPLFLGCWFLHLGTGSGPMWELWRVFITHDYVCSTGQMLTGLGLYTLCFAVPAAAVGWILQFPVCAALDYFHGDKSRDDNPVA